MKRALKTMPRVSKEKQCKYSVENSLPAWARDKWIADKKNCSSNNTMPCLQKHNESLKTHLKDLDITAEMGVAWIRGCYCPAHLQQKRRHAHRNNGVFFAVLVSVCVYILSDCLFGVY